MWKIWSLGAPEEWHKTVTATSFSGIRRTLWPTSVSQNRPKVSVSCWRLYTATPAVYMRRINCDSGTVDISFFYIYFAKNHEIGSLVVRKVEKSLESRQNRIVSLDQFGSRRAVADLLVMFIAWTSQKDLFCLKVDRSANLNPSKSTWRQPVKCTKSKPDIESSGPRNQEKQLWSPSGNVIAWNSKWRRKRHQYLTKAKECEESGRKCLDMLGSRATKLVTAPWRIDCVLLRRTQL